MEVVPDTFSSLFWGYTVMWLCMLGYLLCLVRRMKKIERKLESSQNR